MPSALFASGESFGALVLSRSWRSSFPWLLQHVAPAAASGRGGRVAQIAFGLPLHWKVDNEIARLRARYCARPGALCAGGVGTRQSQCARASMLPQFPGLSHW